MVDYGTADVCEDCYFAHHYGYREHDGRYFAGESDSAANAEPLTLLAGMELADACDAETGEGIATFSSRACDGCGSHLAGSRYALALRGPAPMCGWFALCDREATVVLSHSVLLTVPACQRCAERSGETPLATF